MIDGDHGKMTGLCRAKSEMIWYDLDDEIYSLRGMRTQSSSSGIQFWRGPEEDVTQHTSQSRSRKDGKNIGLIELSSVDSLGKLSSYKYVTGYDLGRFLRAMVGQFAVEIEYETCHINNLIIGENLPPI